MNAASAKRLYFQHIPKTAGTSLTEVIRDCARASGLSVLGPALLDDLLRPDYSRWQDTDVLIGHLAGLPTSVDPGRSVVTVLRHPTTHLASWYRHVREHPGHYFHRVVHDERITFEQWLRDPRFEPLTDNPQARHLGMVPDVPAGDFDPERPHRVQQSFELQRRTCSDDDLERAALRTMRAAAAVGVVERFAEFARLVAGWFGSDLGEVPRRNVGTVEEVSLTPRLAELIEQRCAIDLRLHAAASVGSAAPSVPCSPAAPVGQLSSPGCLPP